MPRNPPLLDHTDGLALLAGGGHGYLGFAGCEVPEEPVFIPGIIVSYGNDDRRFRRHGLFGFIDFTPGRIGRNSPSGKVRLNDQGGSVGVGIEDDLVIVGHFPVEVDHQFEIVSRRGGIRRARGARRPCRRFVHRRGRS